MATVQDEDPYFTRRENLDVSRLLSFAQPGQAPSTAAHFRRDRPDLGITAPNLRDDALMAVVNLRPREGSELWCDERHIAATPVGIGDLRMFDQRRSWVANLQLPFETINFFIPLSAFDSLADELRAPRLDDDAPFAQGAPVHDEVMLHLARSLGPAFDNPRELSALYAEHVFAAIRLRLACTHAGLTPGVDRQRGALATWQVARAKAMLLDDLQRNLSLTDLAAGCGLSASYFARGFKRATGLPPHRWLLAQRVKRARSLLETTALSLAEVALDCGFADQSHLTRVFSQSLGVAPGAWRRLRRH